MYINEGTYFAFWRVKQLMPLVISFQNKPQLKSNETKPGFSKRDSDALETFLDDMMCGGWTCVGGVCDGRDDEIAAEIKEDDTTSGWTCFGGICDGRDERDERDDEIAAEIKEDDTTKTEKSNKRFRKLVPLLKPRAFSFQNKPAPLLKPRAFSIQNKPQLESNETKPECSKRDNDAMNSALTPNDTMRVGRTRVGGRLDRRDDEIAAETKEVDTTKNEKSKKDFHKLVGLRPRSRKPIETKKKKSSSE